MSCILSPILLATCGLLIVVLSSSQAEFVPLLPANDDSTSMNRIVGGENAKEGQFPYQAGLSVRRFPDIAAWCGGSLIAPNWVLTAAHCTIGATSVTVYLGATRRISATIVLTVDAKDIIIHADYNDLNLHNDIALIQIPPVKYSSLVEAVRLPGRSFNSTSFVGEIAIASGWGRTSDSSYSIAMHLQFGHMRVIKNEECIWTYGAVVDPDNVCLSTVQGTSTCGGDSGGPVVLASSGIQIGLVSFGAAYCEKGAPIGCTSLTAHLDWIALHTGLRISN